MIYQEFTDALAEAQTYGYAQLSDRTDPAAMLETACAFARAGGIDRLSVRRASRVVHKGHVNRWSRIRPEDLVALVCVDIAEELPDGFTLGDNAGAGFGVFASPHATAYADDPWAADLDGFEDEWFTRGEVSDVEVLTDADGYWL